MVIQNGRLYIALRSVADHKKGYFMSGHSKWSTIKRQKGANDAKRGQAFTKAGRLITIAAREGGSTDGNYKLRLAVESARAINMPKDNIERAIARGAGGGDSGPLEEVVYEGYGPKGIAVIIEAVTDNRMRTSSEVRSTLDKAGGSLAGPGAVAFNFKTVGEIAVAVKGKDPDELFLEAADAGAEDIETEGDESTIFCKPEDLVKVKTALEEKGYSITSAVVAKEPITTVKIADQSEAEKVLSLVEKLEDLDDVNKVYANFDIEAEVMERVA